MLTEKGFVKLRYDDYIERLEERARATFGENINLSSLAPLGKFIRLIAYERAEENELAEMVYYSSQVSKATGAALDAAVKSFGEGITRIQAKQATGEVVISVSQYRAMPVGTIFGTKDNIRFTTTAEYIAPEPGQYIVPVRAVEFGVIGNVPPGTITEIYTPMPGLDSVTNEKATEKGTERESDAALRERYFNGGLSVRGSSTTNSIKAKLMDEVPGVQSAIVDENTTLETNENGVPGKSVHSIVLGGAAIDIARKIFETKAGGIQAYGGTVVPILDEENETHYIGFDFATEKPIFVHISIQTNDDFPQDGENLVKLEVIKYIGGNDLDENSYKGLGMSRTVVCAKVANVVFNVPGIDDVQVQLSEDGETYSSANVTSGRAEAPRTNFTSVVINIEP